jgi:hypothetical protein
LYKNRKETIYAKGETIQKTTQKHRICQIQNVNTKQVNIHNNIKKVNRIVRK